MKFELRFGQKSLTVDIPESKLVGKFRGPEYTGSESLSARIQRSLDQPVEAPALELAVTPDDKIAILLDSGLPDAAEFVLPIIATLEKASVDSANITVLCTPGALESWLEPLKSKLGSRYPDTVISIHNPADETGLSYLASTKSGRRIYVNRIAANADAMITISRSGFDPQLGFRGTASNLFPLLSDPDMQRISRLAALETRTNRTLLRKKQESDEAAWLAGLFYSMDVALDRTGNVDAIWFGQHDAVLRASQEHSTKAWIPEAPSQKPDLVIAAVCPATRPAEWQAVGTALEIASEISDKQANVLVLSDLASPPGETGQWLIGNDNPWNTLAQLRESNAEDAIATSQFSHAISSHRVHLMSGHTEDFVESLGIISVGSAKEIEKLVQRSTHIYVVEDAERARAPGRRSARPTD